MTVRATLIHCGAREAIIGEKFRSSNYGVVLNVLGKFFNPLLHEYSVSSGGFYDIIDTAKKENIPLMVEYCQNSDIVFIGNESPIVNGFADELRKEGIPVIGPNQHFALEGSKHRTRMLLEEIYPEANPEFYFIDTGISGWENEAKKAIKDLNGKVALKPLEPKYGKGVIVEGDHFSAEQAYKKALDTAQAGPFLIEEKIVGEEWSGQYLCDSKLHIEAFPASRDFKRALENDRGENTGGMATISDSDEILPFMTKGEFERGKKIVERIVRKLSETEGYQGDSLTGVKYPAFVLTGNGVKVFEHNDRFGDPEGLNGLSPLKNDFVDICLGMIDGNLPRLEFEPKAVATIYAVPLIYGGYIKYYSGNKIIKWNEIDFSSQTKIYPGSVELKENGERHIMSSRSVAVVSMADTLEEALAIANEDIKKIDGPVRHRNDINMDYVRRCMEHMKELRNQN